MGLGDLLGGGGGPEYEKPEPWGPTKDLLKENIREIGGLETPTPWQGPYISPMTEQQQLTLDNLTSWLGQGGLGFGLLQNFNPLINQGVGAYGQAARMFGQPGYFAPKFDQAAFDAVYNNPYLEQNIAAVKRPLQEQFAWGYHPESNLQASLAGVSGGTGVGKEGKHYAVAQEANRKSQAEIEGKMRGANLAQANEAGLGYGRQAAQNLLAQAGNLGQLGQWGAGQISPAYQAWENNFQNQLGVGEYMQNYQQALLDAEIQSDYLRQQYPWEYAAQRQNLLMGPAVAWGTGGLMPGSGGGGTLQNMMGGAASGAMIGSAIPGVGTGVGALIGGGLGAFA